MSVNARLALAMLALGQDWRPAAPPAVSAARPAAVPKPEDATSAIADLAQAWLKEPNRDRSKTD